VAHLGDPAEIAALRGRKKRAKTDRADARLLRTLLLQGRFPESWIPPAHVLEIRTLGRLYCTLKDERRAWQQRIHAQLFHQGCPPIRALFSESGRAALASVELSGAGRQYVDTAVRHIDELSVEIEPLRTQLVNFARRQAGCRAPCKPISASAGCARRSCGPRSAMPAGLAASIRGLAVCVWGCECGRGRFWWWAGASCWSAQLFLCVLGSGLAAVWSGGCGHRWAESDRVAPQGKPVMGPGPVAR
jgi:transposase